jgi:hypothetical protein
LLQIKQTLMNFEPIILAAFGGIVKSSLFRIGFLAPLP